MSRCPACPTSTPFCPVVPWAANLPPMARKITLLLLPLLLLSGLRAQLVCQQFGSLVVYSNYDGGFLTIDVDVDIPDLMIGVVAYESVAVTVTGAYAANVTRLVHAGYNGANGGCGSGSSAPSTFNVPPGCAVESYFLPPVTMQSSFGANTVICATTCSTTTSQGAATPRRRWRSTSRTTTSGSCAHTVCSTTAGWGHRRCRRAETAARGPSARASMHHGAPAPPCGSMKRRAMCWSTAGV